MKSRPLLHLQQANKDYPMACKAADIFRADRGESLPNWPDWCFLPMAGYGAIAQMNSSTSRYSPFTETARLSALGTWRMTQGIYKFNSELEKALLNSPIANNIPDEALYKLPEWCVYIETGDYQYFGKKIYGFFAHLEWDISLERTELRLMLDYGEFLVPIVLHIGPWSVQEALNKAIQESDRHLKLLKDDDFVSEYKKVCVIASAKDINPLVSMILYLCSDKADYIPSTQIPRQKKTKKGLRFFPPDKPKLIEVGKILGDAFRKGPHNYEASSPNMRPHIRRGHWHGYWTGQKNKQQTFNYQWLPPTGVNFNLHNEKKAA